MVRHKNQPLDTDTLKKWIRGGITNYITQNHIRITPNAIEHLMEFFQDLYNSIMDKFKSVSGERPITLNQAKAIIHLIWGKNPPGLALGIIDHDQDNKIGPRWFNFSLEYETTSAVRRLVMNALDYTLTTLFDMLPNDKVTAQAIDESLKTSEVFRPIIHNLNPDQKIKVYSYPTGLASPTIRMAGQEVVIRPGPIFPEKKSYRVPKSVKEEYVPEYPVYGREYQYPPIKDVGQPQYPIEDVGQPQYPIEDVGQLPQIYKNFWDQI